MTVCWLGHWHYVLIQNGFKLESNTRKSLVSQKQGKAWQHTDQRKATVWLLLPLPAALKGSPIPDPPPTIARGKAVDQGPRTWDPDIHVKHGWRYRHLASAWVNNGCCCHLGTETAHGRYLSVHCHPPSPKSAFQITSLNTHTMKTKYFYVNDCWNQWCVCLSKNKTRNENVNWQTKINRDLIWMNSHLLRMNNSHEAYMKLT